MVATNLAQTGRVKVLGGVQAYLYSEQPLTFSGARSQELLASLALDAGKPVRRDVLIDRLWPDSNESGGRKALNTELWRLKKTIKEAKSDPQDWLVSSKESLMLRVDRGVEVDLHQFDRCIYKVDTPEQLTTAVNLYRGDFAEGLNACWVAQQRHMIRTRFVRVLQKLVDALRRVNQLTDALTFAERLCNEEPFDEAAHQRLILVLIERGDRSAAVRHFKSFAQQLRGELGIDPSPETTELYHRCLNNESTEKRFYVEEDIKRETAPVASPKPNSASTPPHFTVEPVESPNLSDATPWGEPANLCEGSTLTNMADQIHQMKGLAEKLLKVIHDVENNIIQIEHLD